MKVGVGPESESDNRNCQESESDDGISDSTALVETEFGVVSLILLVYKFQLRQHFSSFFFSIFQASWDRERWLTASVRHFIQCGILLERLFSCKSESITAAHVRGHSTAMICSVQKCNSLFCDVGCHVFRNRQRKI